MPSPPWPGFLCPALGCPSAEDTVRVYLAEVFWWVRVKVYSGYYTMQQTSRKRFTEGWGVKAYLRVGTRLTDRQNE